MKTILAVWLLSVLPLLADSYVFGSGSTTLRTWTIGTNAVPGASTNSTAWTNATAASSYYDLDLGNRQSVLLILSANTTSATNAAVFTAGLKYSWDATNWYTLNALRVPLTLNYTNTAITSTNLNTSGFQYLRVGTLENVSNSGATNTVTNIVIRLYYK